jgi:hypothetical protein
MLSVSYYCKHATWGVVFVRDRLLPCIGSLDYVGATDGVYRWSPGVNHRVGIALVGEALGASIEGSAIVEVSDGQIATFKVNVNAGFEATVSHGSFSKETGVWTIPGVKGDVAAQRP